MPLTNKRSNAGRKPLGDEPLGSTIIARVSDKQKETYKARGGSQWLRRELDVDPVGTCPVPACALPVTTVTRQEVPFYEYSVQAGFPSPAEGYREKLDFNDLLIENTPATYVFRVAGDSMIDAGIHDGDLMVVDRSKKPRSNDIVIMRINTEFTVKRFVKTADGFFLKAENSSGLYKDLYPKEGEEWALFGVVTFVIKPFTHSPFLTR